MINRLKSKTPLLVVKIYDTIQLGYRFIFKRKRKTVEHDFKEPFFIIGCGRSGNTLLRSMLISGGEASIPPESYVWPRIIRIYETYNFLPWEKICSLIIAEFEAYKEFYTWEINLFKAHEKARRLPKSKRSLSYIIQVVYSTYQEEKNEEHRLWGDKTPINTLFIDKILKVYPKAKYIHILREPKDVTSSYVKAGLYEKHKDAANFWISAIEKVSSLKKKIQPNKFHQVQYENLVRFPEHELKKICKFLNMSYSPKMLDFWKNKDSLGDVKYGKHHANIGSPINEDSIGKWKDVLNEEQENIIDELTESLYQNIKN